MSGETVQGTSDRRPGSTAAEDVLHRLVYYSRNRVARDALAAAVDDILAVSRSNNAAAGVTGALIFNAGCFAQVLEGRRGDLESLFERIQRDQRHGEVSLLAFEPVRSRTFAQWSMGFVGRRPEDAAAFAEIGPASGFDPSKVDGDTLFEALRDLAIQDEGARD